MRARKSLPSDAKVLEFPFSNRSPEQVRDGGYVRLWRRLFKEGDSLLGTDRRLIGAWIELFATAAYEPTKVRFGEQSITLERGQLIVNYRDFARNWGMPLQTMHDICKRMEKEGRIRLETRRVNAGKVRVVTVATVVNFDLYQTAEPRTATGQQPDSKPEVAQGVNAKRQTAAGQQPDTFLKEGKEGNIDSDPSLRSGSLSAKADPGVPKQMVEIWKTELGALLPIPRTIDGTRRQKLLARYSDTFGSDLEQWRQLCRRVRASPHLTGENDRAWRADIDFCLEPRKLNRILEGFYDRKGNGHDQRYRRPSAIQEFWRRHSGEADSGGIDRPHLTHG